MQNQTQPAKVVFVWDRSKNGIAQAVHQAGPLLENASCLLVVHVMPHESIYTYSSLHENESQASQLIQLLHAELLHQIKRYDCFDRCSFQLLFGDRIHEICHFAKRARADVIVTPRFRQSAFSKWIHGDLNESMKQQAPCEVFCLNDQTTKQATAV